MPEPGDRGAALGALYQAERQDAAQMLVTSLALIAGGLTYLGVAAVLINNVALPGGPWVLAFLAFPLWVVASFHVLLVANALVRASSIDIIERRITAMAGFSESLRTRLGSRAGQRVTNIAEQYPALKLQTIITYGGVLIIIVMFTFYCLDVAAKSKGWASVPVILAEVVYFLLFGAIAWAWKYTMGLAGEVTSG
jgi:hypothetical protein